MKAEMKRSLMKVLLVVGILIAALSALPATSHASAYGIQYWGAFTVNIGGQSVGVPSGLQSRWAMEVHVELVCAAGLRLRRAVGT